MTIEVNLDGWKAGELISESYRKAFATIVHDEMSACFRRRGSQVRVLYRPLTLFEKGAESIPEIRIMHS